MPPFLAHGEILIVETEDDRYLGSVEIVEDHFVIRSGFVGRPAVVPAEDVTAIYPPSPNED